VVLVDRQTLQAGKVADGLRNIDTDAKAYEVDVKDFTEVQRVNETVVS
jgi:hypothetical protein